MQIKCLLATWTESQNSSYNSKFCAGGATMEVYSFNKHNKTILYTTPFKDGTIIVKSDNAPRQQKNKTDFLYVKLGLSIYSYREVWSYKKEIKSMQESRLQKSQRQKVSINPRLRAIQIIVQRKAFCRQRILESSCAWKKLLIETCYIDMIRIYDIDVNIYQGNAQRKELSWRHFADESKAQGRQQVKDHQSYIRVCSAYLTYPSSSQQHRTTHDNSIPFKIGWQILQR